MLIVLFVAVVVAVIAITKGQRRIPTQSAKHVRGRRVFGGTRQFLPLQGQPGRRHAGHLRQQPSGAAVLRVRRHRQQLPDWGWAVLLQDVFQTPGLRVHRAVHRPDLRLLLLLDGDHLQPKDMANNLKDYGSFIPGYRPGKRTADYLERVMMRITYVGAAFLAVVAVIPTLITTTLNINYMVASFYGGTGLLIVISVALDLVQKINSHLVMRNYPGLTED